MQLTPAPMNYFVQAVDPRIRVARILATLSLLYGLVELGVRGVETMLGRMWGNQVYFNAIQMLAAVAIMAAAIRALIRVESVWPLIITMIVEMLVQLWSVAAQMLEVYEAIGRSGTTGGYRMMFMTSIYHINYAMLPAAAILILWPGRARTANVLAP